MQLRERFDTRVAGADEDEAELGRIVRMDRRALELQEHAVPQGDRVGEILEADSVLEQARDRKRARGRSECDDESLVADLEHARERLDGDGLAFAIEAGHAAEDELGVRAHLAQRDYDVAWLERPRGRLGQKWRVEHEVLERDDGRAAALEEPRDVAAGEASAQDQRSRHVPRVAPRVMLTTMARQVAVIGSGAEWETAAEEVGRLLAESGCTVVTGGLGEVMAAAHRGAKSAGGTTIAILPGEDRTAANPWADHVVVTGIGHARNLAVAATGDAVIAIGGSYGTLAEMALALRLGRTVVALEGAPEVDGALRATAPADAVGLALRHLG